MNRSNIKLFALSWLVLTLGAAASGVTLLHWYVSEDAVSRLEFWAVVPEAAAACASLWYILHYKWTEAR